MNDSEAPAHPDPAAETSRLDRIEARLAVLEDRIAGAGAALPPPREVDMAAPTPTTGGPGAVPPGLSPAFGSLNDFVRNNPVLSLIGVVIVLVLLSHLFS